MLNYDGRQLCQPRFQGMRAERLSPTSVGYTMDMLAVIDHADAKTVRLIDPLSGKQLGSLQHSIEVEQVALSHVKGLRRLAIVDKNRDLYLTPVHGAQEMHKLHTMVDTVRWNDDNISLCAVADGQFVIWDYPEAAMMDRELLPLTLTKQQAAELGHASEVVDFRGTRATVRGSDGAVITYSSSPYPALLERFTAAAEWEPALRLCRYVKSQQLWACLAAMAVAGKELHTAEVAYAAIEHVDKLLFMCHIKELPTVEAREAELLLFRRRQAEAIQVLVQGGWVYRAIKARAAPRGWMLAGGWAAAVRV